MLPDASAFKLASVLRGVRPDLDIYVTTHSEVEKLASDPAAACARRIFYAAEDVDLANAIVAKVFLSLPYFTILAPTAGG